MADNSPKVPNFFWVDSDAADYLDGVFGQENIKRIREASGATIEFPIAGSGTNFGLSGFEIAGSLGSVRKARNAFRKLEGKSFYLKRIIPVADPLLGEWRLNFYRPRQQSAATSSFSSTTTLEIEVDRSSSAVNCQLSK